MGLASCPDGQFQCIQDVQDCLSMEQVCDFHRNCADGSDEEFCGSYSILIKLCFPLLMTHLCHVVIFTNLYCKAIIFLLFACNNTEQISQLYRTTAIQLWYLFRGKQMENNSFTIQFHVHDIRNSLSFVTGSCDFEEHACGWINSSKDEFKWRREMANISAVPGVDHTTGSPWGRPLD